MDETTEFYHVLQNKISNLQNKSKVKTAIKTVVSLFDVCDSRIKIYLGPVVERAIILCSR